MLPSNSRLKTALILAVFLLVIGVSSSPSGASRDGQDPNSDGVPDECLFFDPDGDKPRLRDRASLYGLSAESQRLDADFRSRMNDQDQLERSAPKPPEEDSVPDVPEGAILWGDLAVTREDHDRLAQIAKLHTKNILAVRDRAPKLLGDSFVGVTWSYLDGFIISTTGNLAAAEKAVEDAFPDLPFKIHQGIVSYDIMKTNLERLR